MSSHGKKFNAPYNVTLVWFIAISIDLPWTKLRQIYKK